MAAQEIQAGVPCREEDAQGIEPFDPFHPAFRQDPYPFYHRYRAVSPVHRVVGPSGRSSWYLFRYEDVGTALREPSFIREARRIFPPGSFAPIPECQSAFWRMTDSWLLFRDPPDHTRLRSLLNRAFTAPIVERTAPRIETVAAELLDRVADRGRMDLILDYAFPLPVIVIAELLGVPPEDRERFREWSMTLASAIDLKPTVAGYEEGNRATLELTAYLREIVDARRLRPREDLISDLVRAHALEGRVSEDELLGTLTLLILAGHETTVNLIGNGILALLRAPSELARLRRHPAILSQAVEELLRYESPVQMTRRLAAEDLIFGGRQIRCGDDVRILIGAANRDPEVFPDPDRLDLTRTESPHRAFGLGIHFCVGAMLGRTEGGIAIDALLRRFPNLRLEEGPLSWRESVGFRSLTNLAVSF
jgi:cytochrome P450